MARFDGEFAEFYSTRFVLAQRTAYALCGNWLEAEEVAQHAFVRLYAKWPRVAKGSPDAYLRTVLTRLFLDSRRRGRGRVEAVAELPDQAGPEDVGGIEDREPLLAALRQVPPRQRATLMLRIVHDLSVEQVAQVLDCSEGTVRSQMARGMRTLREAYRSADPTGRGVHDVG